MKYKLTIEQVRASSNHVTVVECDDYEIDNHCIKIYLKHKIDSMYPLSRILKITVEDIDDQENLYL